MNISEHADDQDRFLRYNRGILTLSFVVSVGVCHAAENVRSGREYVSLMPDWRDVKRLDVLAGTCRSPSRS